MGIFGGSDDAGAPARAVTWRGVLPTLLVLAGYAGFLAATFGWPTWQARRQMGDSRWRRPVSPLDGVAETACLVGCALSLLAGPLALAGLARPVAVVPAGPRVAVGGALLALGTAIAVWAQRHLAEQWRAGVEPSSSLVTDGPFARVRNPFYLGCLLASAGVVAGVPSGVALAGLALHLAATQVIVRAVEEPVLVRAHGAHYARYAARTGRFLPRRSG